MDGAQHCGDQSAEYHRLMKSALSKAEAQLLRNLSASGWSRLAGQIERYNALVCEQRRRDPAQISQFAIKALRDP